MRIVLLNWMGKRKAQMEHYITVTMTTGK